MTLGPGAIAGVYAVVPILKSLSFMPELIYVQKYGSRTGTTLGDAKVQYVEVPLLAKLPFFWGTYITEGISLSFPVNVSGWPAAQGLANTTSPDVSIPIGGGYNITKKFAAEFRWEAGLRRVSTIDTAPVQRARSFMVIAKLHL